MDRKNIIQTLHVYDPFTLTHYKANWVSSSDTKLTFANTVGDWMTFNKITLKSITDTLEIIPANTSWDIKK